jgi:hypothetical protein
MSDPAAVENASKLADYAVVTSEAFTALREKSLF